jgi:hypothetical protein
MFLPERRLRIRMQRWLFQLVIDQPVTRRRLDGVPTNRPLPTAMPTWATRPRPLPKRSTSPGFASIWARRLITIGLATRRQPFCTRRAARTEALAERVRAGMAPAAFRVLDTNEAHARRGLWKQTRFAVPTRDYAIEVWSPANTEDEMNQKAANYLAHGSRLVWLLRPQDRTVRIHSLDGPVQVLRDSDLLSGEKMLPGFSVPVSGLFLCTSSGCTMEVEAVLRRAA